MSSLFELKLQMDNIWMVRVMVRARVRVRWKPTCISWSHKTAAFRNISFFFASFKAFLAAFSASFAARFASSSFILSMKLGGIGVCLWVRNRVRLGV